MVISLNTKGFRFNKIGQENDINKKIQNMDIPPFVRHTPNIASLKKVSEELKGYKNLIIIGNGGSINSSWAFYKALGSDKRVCFVTTMEPEYLQSIAKKYEKNNSLVVVISKSGTTIGVLESMMFFINKDYTILGITSKNSTLYKICRKKEYKIINHPEVGGRYSARTSSALLPAALMGIKIEDLEKGFKNAYKKYSPKLKVEQNPALKLAASLYTLEKKGKYDVFLPVYSTQLEGFLPIIIQLMHESFGKNGKGQSYFGSLAPESQHHTNQRFFGGKKNICGLFLTSTSQNKEVINIPDELADIKIKDYKLGFLDKLQYKKSLEFEFMGTYNDALEKKIPVCCLNLEKTDTQTIGEFMGFWQYMAVFSSLIRDVNPYDQPQVERSKEISFEKRNTCLQ
ncbi:MAG: hypothetical protein ACQESF_00410 [Nanobdellota archaeon]